MKVYEDAGISGAKGRDQRPALDAMMKAVNAKEFDMVAPWSVDRLGRSLTDLLGILQGLHEKGVGLFLHQQGLDTSTTAGKAMFQMLGVFAEFERGIIRESVNAGLACARAKGTKLGRRRVQPAIEARIFELKASGDGILKIVPEARDRHQCGVAGPWPEGDHFTNLIPRNRDPSSARIPQTLFKPAISRLVFLRLSPALFMDLLPEHVLRFFESRAQTRCVPHRQLLQQF